MRRGRIILILAFLLIVGVVAVGFIMTRGGGTSTGVAGPTSTPLPPETVDIVVVVQPIPMGTVIDQAYLDKVPYPKDLFVENMYMTDVAEVIGRRARFDLEPGVALNKSYLADSAEEISVSGSDVSFLIEPGKVAVSIPISRLSSVSYAPQRGDHVNVIVTLLLIELDPDFQSVLPNYTAAVLAPGPSVLLGIDAQQLAGLTTNEQLRNLTAQIAGGGVASRQGRVEVDPFLEQTLYVMPSESQRPRLVSQTLIQNVMIVQVGTYKQEKDTAAATMDTGAPTPTPLPTSVVQTAVEEEELPDIITLSVSPQDAVTLNYLIYAGAQLTLALRPVNDTTDPVQTQAVTLDFLLNTYNISRPVKLDIGLEPRLDKLVTPALPNDVKPTPEER